MNFKDDLLLAFESGDYQQAIEIGRKWCAESPESSDAWYSLGTAFVENSNVDEAISCLEEAIKIDPESWSAMANLGSARCRKKEHDSGALLFEKALKVTDSEEGYATILARLVDCYICLGNYAKAFELLPNLYKVDEDTALMLEGKIVRGIIPGTSDSLLMRLRSSFHDIFSDGIKLSSYKDIYRNYKLNSRKKVLCRYCSKPLRTPLAKQCQHCFKSWHDSD